MSNNNKTFATTAVLATVAVVMTITALSLVSPQSSWDGTLLTDLNLDSSLAAVTAAIPNTPDVWSAFDAVSDAMSSDWLIPPAFAAPTIIDINGNVPDISGYVYISTTEGNLTTLLVTATGNGAFVYTWSWDSGIPPANLQGLNTSAITFTAPQVDGDVVYYLTVYVDDDDNYTSALIDLTVLDAGNATNTPPTVNAGPDLPTVTKGQEIELPGATATDTEDDDGNLTILWTANPSSAVTITNGDTLTPTIVVSSTTNVASVTLTMSVTDSGNLVVTDTRVLTIQDAVVVNTPPTVNAGPDLPTVTKGQEIELPGATATDTEDDDGNLTILWTANPSSAVTITNGDTLTPTIVVSSTTNVASVTLTMSVTDSGNLVVTDTRVLTIQDAVVVNTPPTVNAGPDLPTVTKGQEIELPGATATDTEDDDGNLTILWTANPSSAVTITNGDTLTPTIVVSSTTNVASVTLTMSVTDSGNLVVTDTRVLTIQDAVVVNTPPTVNAGPDLPTVTKGQEIELPGATATDTEDDDGNLTILWTANPSSAVTITNGDTLTPTIVVSSTTNVASVTLTMSVTDSGNLVVTDTRVLTIQDAVVVNTPPTVNAGPDLPTVTKGQEIELLGATATDTEDDDGNLTILWTANPSSAVTITNGDTLTPTIVVSSTTNVASVTLTMSVTDSGNLVVTDTRVLTIQDAVVVNTPPTVNAGPDLPTVTKEQEIELPGATATDTEDDDGNLTILWTANPSSAVTITNGDTLTPTIVVSSTTNVASVTLTMSVTDSGNLVVTDTRVLTIQVPLKVSSVTYNPGSGQLRITFNQNIDSNPTYSDIHIRSTGSITGGITLSDVIPAPTSSDRTITATLNSTQKETYADLTSPQLHIASGAVTDVDDGSTGTDPLTVNISTVSSKKKSSSSSSAPIVDLTTLAQARIVNIPSVISEQVSSHNAADPLEPMLRNNTFDFPLTINDYYYLLDDTTNTLTPRTVTAGQSTEIEFTVYTSEDLVYFILYLNLQDDDTRYAGSDTYITYNGDTVTVTDSHGYIADATITVTQEDNSMPEKKTVTITIEFDEPMGLTNMVAYMWNTDRKSTIINLIDAIDVTAAAETRQNSASTDDSSRSAKVNSEPDASDDDRSDGQNSQPVIKSGIVIIGGDADDAQTLSLIRMWSGFASESITDAELLESMGLDNYPVVHIPDWVMTELGALVSNNDVTVKEFRTALVYMLEMLTA